MKWEIVPNKMVKDRSWTMFGLERVDCLEVEENLFTNQTDEEWFIERFFTSCDWKQNSALLLLAEELHWSATSESRERNRSSFKWKETLWVSQYICITLKAVFSPCLLVDGTFSSFGWQTAIQNNEFPVDFQDVYQILSPVLGDFISSGCHYWPNNWNDVFDNDSKVLFFQGYSRWLWRIDWFWRSNFYFPSWFLYILLWARLIGLKFTLFKYILSHTKNDENIGIYVNLFWLSIDWCVENEG